MPLLFSHHHHCLSGSCDDDGTGSDAGAGDDKIPLCVVSCSCRVQIEHDFIWHVRADDCQNLRRANANAIVCLCVG